MKVFHTCLCNVATLVVFSIKLHKHSPLPRSLINTHLCHEATTTLFFSNKAGSTLHLHWSHANVCHEVASPLIFVMKLRQLLNLHWSITITLSTEENLHLSFLMKPFQHEAMLTIHLQLSHTNIHICHGATSTLYLHWSRANIRLCRDIASTLHLHWSRTNIGLYNGVALAPIFRGNKV